MNKEEFVNFISGKRNCSKVEANNGLNMIIESIKDALSAGESINLVGFGTFEVKRREAREGRNPQTGAVLQIGASNQPTFRAGKALKDACNEDAGTNNKKKDTKAKPKENIKKR